MTRKEALKVSVGDILKLKKYPTNGSIRVNGNIIWSGGEFEVKHIITDGYNVRFQSTCPSDRGYSSFSYATPSEVEFVSRASSTTEKIQASIDEHKAEMTKLAEKIEKAEAKLAFLEETGSEEFNETEFKAYQTLKLIEENPNMSRLEKAKAIAAIVSAG